jgi:hypothetical protein
MSRPISAISSYHNTLRVSFRGGNGIANAKMTSLPIGEQEMVKKKNALLESVPALVLLGLLAGAVGGLGIGLIQLKAASSSSSSATGK